VPIPLLEYAPKSQNQRVANFEVPGDEQVRIFTTDNILSPGDMGVLIEAAYRQIFFHAFACDREPMLETQLRIGQITVRGFIRGLLLSDTYKRSFYDLNSNYRFVEHCIQKVLGRDVYHQREKIAWSTAVSTKGFKGFIDELLNSQEYLENFGENIVPYHRRRVVSGRSTGDLPFNIKSPRYDGYHRAKLGFPQTVWQNVVKRFASYERTPKTGDPALFMSMARSINPLGGTPQSISSYNIDIEKSVPRR
jgi:phycobilisome rod-core linker protein